MGKAHDREVLAQRHQAGHTWPLFLVKPITPVMLADAAANTWVADTPRPVDPLSHSPRLDGLRVLVVEDNPTNRQVAKELLTAEGAQVQLAEDGELGLRAALAADPPFDAVLMDLQMPRMDGLTATAHIREHRALAADRAACLAAGMNDHVAKPIELDDLVATLLRHARPGAAVPARRAEVTSATGAAGPELLAAAQRHGVDLAGALARLGGDTRLYGRAWAGVIDELPTLLDSFETHAAQGAWRDAQICIHSIKGLAATLGAKTLRRAAEEGEAACGRGGGTPDSAAVPALAARMRATAAPLQGEINALLRALADGPAPSAEAGVGAKSENLPGPDDSARLAELLTLLQGSDMRALDAFEKLRALAAPAGSGWWGALAESIEALDFDRASAECRRLLEAETA